MRFRAFCLLPLLFPLVAQAFEISGTVTDQDGHVVEGVAVRVQARPVSALTDQDGAYHLVDPAVTPPVRVTAGKPGYAAGEQVISQDGLQGIVLQLRSVDPDDPNEDLSSLTPDFCKLCHQNLGADDLYGQSVRSRHANAGKNAWVEATLRDFRTRNPQESGFCADCHAPAAFVRTKRPGASDLTNPDTVDLLALDPNDPYGPRTHGVQCITCHRVSEVTNDIKAFNFAGGAVLDKSSTPLQVHGPWDDVVEMRSVPNPVYTQSLYCSPCHEYERPADGGRPAIPGQSTYSEWLRWQARLPEDSPFKGTGTCQHCHMPAPEDGKTHYACSLQDTPRDPAFQPVRDHTFLGTTMGPGDPNNLLDGAAGIDLQAAQIAPEELEISVQLTNLTAGHMLPTGIDLRNMLLSVEAWDSTGHSLELVAERSSTLPWWAGEGSGPEDRAGMPGKGYAKILSRSLENPQDPQYQYAVFAEALCEVQDNRIEGFLADTSSYVFRMPSGAGRIKILARAVLRRAPAGFTEQLDLPRTDALGNPLSEFELSRARMFFEPAGFAPLPGTVRLDFEADGAGVPFSGPSAPADTAFLDQGLSLSSKASPRCGTPGDGHAYATLDPSEDRVISPSTQAAHNECEGGILRLDFSAPVGHVQMQIAAQGIGGGFELRALDAGGREIALQRIYDAPANCELHPVLQSFPIHLDHHGIAAIEARGLVEATLDEQVAWSIRRLEYRFDSFHPATEAAIATPTPGTPPTPTPSPTPQASQPTLPASLSAGQSVVHVQNISPPGCRVEIRTLGGLVLGAGTAGENGRASIWLLRPLREGETVFAIELRTLQQSAPVTAQFHELSSSLDWRVLLPLLLLGLPRCMRQRTLKNAKGN